MAQDRRVDIPALLLALIHQIAAKERSRGNPFAGFRIATYSTFLGPCWRRGRDPAAATPRDQAAVGMIILFRLGALVATPAALDACEVADVSPSALLERHASGDWGEVSAGDARENELSVRERFRVL
jgi:hypothetical protein